MLNNFVSQSLKMTLYIIRIWPTVEELYDDLIFYFIGAAVAQVVKRVSAYWKVGSLIPSSTSLHVKVSLGKTLKPKLLPGCMNEFPFLEVISAGS